MNFQETETCTLLMRAYAGECQSHVRYLLASKAAAAQQLHVIRQVFEFTAKQELIHAQQFAEMLTKNGVSGIRIAAEYPLDAPDDLMHAMLSSAQFERNEAEGVYPAFAETAAREEQKEAAALFRMIAEIEQMHANRFTLFGSLMEQDKLFREDQPTQWLCLNCGHIHEGTEAPQNCPVCGAVQGFAVRRNLAPFTPAGTMS